MPELHILPLQLEGEQSSDAHAKKKAVLIESDKIPIDKHDVNQPDDYRLVPMTTESYFYIVAPKDMILVKPRDCDDHITFLILKEKSLLNSLSLSLLTSLLNSLSLSLDLLDSAAFDLTLSKQISKGVQLCTTIHQPNFTALHAR